MRMLLAVLVVVGACGREPARDEHAAMGGAKVQARPENKPWGVREMQVADPDGNVLRGGSPIRK